MRYRAHDAGARTLAQWLQGRAEVAQVLHPALQGSPGHTHWRALCAADGGGGLAAGLFSVVFDARYSPAQVDAARGRALQAGRRYPNLVDNMWAARHVPRGDEAATRDAHDAG